MGHQTQFLRRRALVIGVPVDVLDWDEALARVSAWAMARESRYVCLVNVHSAVSAVFDSSFQQVLAGADLATSDGAPVTWMLRQLGAPKQRRINGPDLMWRYLRENALRGGKVYFYGSSPETLVRLRARVEAEFPGIQVVGAYSPPFRQATMAEDDEDVARINASGAEVVFVGLGCPKQERWMALHLGRVQAVMVGVGAAFDYFAGVQPRAPEWMQHHGLEWAYRVVREPGRLWRRYLFTNVPFLFVGGGQWLASRITGARPAALPPVPAVVEDRTPGDQSEQGDGERSRCGTAASGPGGTA